eukprot:7670876-Lingulodinium_polyedra.AAC.1
MRTTGDPRDTPAPEWASPGDGEDNPEGEPACANGQNGGGDAADLPRAGWELNGHTGCQTRAALHACH